MFLATCSATFVDLQVAGNIAQCSMVCLRYVKYFDNWNTVYLPFSILRRVKSLPFSSLQPEKRHPVHCSPHPGGGSWIILAFRALNGDDDPKHFRIPSLNNFRHKDGGPRWYDVGGVYGSILLRKVLKNLKKIITNCHQTDFVCSWKGNPRQKYEFFFFGSTDVLFFISQLYSWRQLTYSQMQVWCLSLLTSLVRPTPGLWLVKIDLRLKVTSA